MTRNNDSFILKDINDIKSFIQKISPQMFKHLESQLESKYVLFYKYLTHSDLPTFGKATSPNSLDKNLLYYLTKEDMEQIEKETNRPFQTAHQSCIGLKKDFYTSTNLPNPREKDIYLINDYMNVYLVNENLHYFTSKYTYKIFDKLNKNISNTSNWKKEDIDINTTVDDFLELDLHVAVHGLGISTDKIFHKLRHHIFKGDTLILLYEKNKENRDNLFLILEKNPVFFSILGETNKIYEEYQRNLRNKLVHDVTQKENAIETDTATEDEVTRQQQSVWRKMLANEMMSYTQIPEEVFCPFTYITANFNQLGALFIASHIKGFGDPNTTNEEKYDINNGLLLSANADSLFDKHLISINKDKELVFSFLLDTDYKLKNQLLLSQPIFKSILNDKRMEYIHYHYLKFKEKEFERRTQQNVN